MKRLIALVLSLVMALSLCAPAWGVPEGWDSDDPPEDMPKATVVKSSEYEKVPLPWGDYGQWSPNDEVDENPKLEAAYTFSCKETSEDAEKNDYANWHCDFVVALDRDLEKNQIFLGGNYGSFGWVGFHNPIAFEANKEIPLLGSVTSNPWTYADVASFVGTFICGVGDVNNALAGATFTVMLRLTNPENTDEFYNVATITHTFDNDNSAKCVAKIDSESYSSLQAAIDAAQPGQTVTLFSNVALTETINVAKSITIDGNGHKFVNLGTTTTNTAFMLGDSTWGEDKVAECNITLKNATFDGWATDHVVRVQGVKATIDNCTFQNCTSANVAFGVVTLNYAEATVQNCTFTNNNCAMVVNVNYSVPETTVLTKSNTIDNCVFTENTVSGVSVVYYSQGGGFVCKNSEFTKNVVNTSSHAAVVYGEEMTVTGNTFTDNTVTAAGARAGVVVAASGKVNENAFSNNTLSSTNEDAKYAATVVSKGDGFALDLNANYWGDGKAPAEGVDYVNAKPAEANTITATTYYKTYADGKLSDLFGPVVATVDGVEHDDFQEAVNAVADKGTINVVVAGESAVVSAAKTFTVTGEAATITAADGYKLTVDGDKYTVEKLYTVSFDANGGSGEMKALTIVAGDEYKLPDCTFTAPEGKQFKGWGATANAAELLKTPYIVNADATLYAIWENVPSAPVVPPVVEVPVSGDDVTVKVEAVVSGTTATIEKVDDLDKVISDKVDTGTVTIDLFPVRGTVEDAETGESTVAPIDTVTLPTKVIEDIAKAADAQHNDTESLEIILGGGVSVEFDAKALANKAEKAEGEEITISIKPVSAVEEKLSDAQKKAVGDNKAFSVSVTSGDKNLFSKEDKENGTIILGVPYELKSGESAWRVVVYYVDDNGVKHECKTSYDSATKRVNWETDHLSVYMIDQKVSTGGGYVDTTPDTTVKSPSTFDAGVGLYVGMSVLSAMGGAVVIGKKRED